MYFKELELCMEKKNHLWFYNMFLRFKFTLYFLYRVKNKFFNNLVWEWRFKSWALEEDLDIKGEVSPMMKIISDSKSLNLLHGVKSRWLLLNYNKNSCISLSFIVVYVWIVIVCLIWGYLKRVGSCLILFCC